jgi:type IV pilus assembly protein PilY1
MDLTELTYSCPTAAYGSAVYGPKTLTSQSSCKLNGGNWECERTPLNTFDHHDQLLTADEKVTVGTNRYFGFHAYGGTRRIFDTEAGAIAFDKLRVTDKPNFTCEGLNCSLVDVTIPDNAYSTLPAVNGVAQRYIPASKLSGLKRAGPEDPGWFIRYTNNPAERTASGSTVLAGVVFWSSFSPFTAAGADVCSLSAMNDRSYSWQADAITGLPDQAQGFRTADGGFIPSRETKTQAPPGEPTPVIAISKTGAIKYQVALSAAGSAPSTETLSSRKNTTPDISWMEVPSNLHECRHENPAACGDGEEASAPTP